MKKTLIVVFLLSSMCYAGKVDKEVEKYQAEYQKLAQTRQQYIDTIKKIEIEMIKVQAVIEYIQGEDNETKNK